MRIFMFVRHTLCSSLFYLLLFSLLLFLYGSATVSAKNKRKKQLNETTVGVKVKKNFTDIINKQNEILTICATLKELRLLQFRVCKNATQLHDSLEAVIILMGPFEHLTIKLIRDLINAAKVTAIATRKNITKMYKKFEVDFCQKKKRKRLNKIKQLKATVVAPNGNALKTNVKNNVAEQSLQVNEMFKITKKMKNTVNDIIKRTIESGGDDESTNELKGRFEVLFNYALQTNDAAEAVKQKTYEVIKSLQRLAAINETEKKQESPNGKTNNIKKENNITKENSKINNGNKNTNKSQKYSTKTKTVNTSSVIANTSKSHANTEEEKGKTSSSSLLSSSDTKDGVVRVGVGAKIVFFSLNVFCGVFFYQQ